MSSAVPAISVTEYSALLEAGDEPFLLDVRRPDEYAFANLRGTLIPLQELPQRIGDLEAYRNQPVVVHCRSGARSAQATAFLLQEGFTDVRNLSGGILAWSREIDPAVPTY